MGLFNNPLGYAGYPPGVTGTPTTQNSTVRAATAAEAAAGTLTNCYLSPATAESASALDFASPPAAGFGSTTPRPVATTQITMSEGGNVIVGTVTGTKIGTATTQKLGFFNATPIVQPANTTDIRTTLINLGLLASGGANPLNLNGGNLTANRVNGDSSAGAGIAGSFTSPNATTDAIQCVNGSIKVPATSVAGASPVVNNVRTGQASFTDVIANGAYGTLTITNSFITASSVIIAASSCTTANSAVQIVDIVPGSGSVALRLFNAGSASTAANININFWVLN